MTVTSGPEITRYVQQVRAALADLPPAVRDELLEDLPEHLAEIAAEGEGPLVDRLGPPAAYAAELRAAADIPVKPPAPNLDDRIAGAVRRGRTQLKAADTRLGPLIGYPMVSDFLRLLRPAWWVLRGYLAAMVVGFFVNGNGLTLVPRVDGTIFGTLFLIVAFVVGSIWLGRRGADRLGRWQRRGLHAVGVVVAVFGFVALVDSDPSPTYYTPTYSDPYSEVRDVYVYDEQGRLIQNARLLDQDGRPIRLGQPWCEEAIRAQNEGSLKWTYPYCPEGAPIKPFATEVPAPSLPPIPSPSEAAPTDAAPTGPGPSPTATVEPTPSTSGVPEPTSTG
ncbi:HAAS signaling domain-containing protein [Polymorphospora rubra]|uniref:Uncharacterized protein n=1 Tax=Polymorphospora rubra TaxID=338584 RepID=A0A810MTV7_9ACTN|nr:hypothetical protein [Polymorphospora rubra]BCJ64412.1 hypothetical protein Prubr_14330 [Polymorphospora rubra]